ncbi:hypothetical protein E1B28_001077 [Marasmius oreades]|uniref:TECPR1-like DysF domain-containing protein n=1 Tax=Marasmius oreades TaxID=181124 RepID=A0A9P8AFA3_9AGAR|nr:uncharacterized protein E1B28_001077 [Marasmius oreades]KAG7099210.1 hypothetical protein E1B28_001077 [Marasmius oreades]
MASPVPPPPLSSVDPSTSEVVNKRLSPPHRFPISFSTPNLRGGISNNKSKLKRPPKLSSQSTSEPENTTSLSDPLDINLNIQAVQDDEDDRYEWAVLYENQRGITLFSTSYYSSNSLLPSDPPPFTVPTLSQKRSHQPVVSLTEYPLPDGNWRWVSKSWMIDMRTDSGEVQHDGFEYNWVFRRHHWRAQVGSLSSGGYVRRRRWVRLMMRPGTKTKQGEEIADSIASPGGTPASPSLTTSWIERHRRQSMPPSVLSPSVFTTSSQEEYVELWQGNLEEDWKMCRCLLRMAGRDGAKLDLWQRWLGLLEENDPNLRPGNSPSTLPTPPIEYLKAILHAHAAEILESLVFPESRARFIQFLERARVYGELQQGLTPNWSRVGNAGVAFWSLNSEMASDKGLSGIEI